MLLTVDTTNRIVERAALREMYAARKAIFVDLLKWDLPVLDKRFEIDQFDDGHALYLILLDAERHHLASARLLPTTRPTILGGLFPELCDGPVPAGPAIYEITRFCLSRTMRAPARRRARDQLVTALAQFALSRGISTYTGVAEIGWLDQILAFGWDAEPLGKPCRIGGLQLGALRITIDGHTQNRLAEAGVYAEPGLRHELDCAA